MFQTGVVLGIYEILRINGFFSENGEFSHFFIDEYMFPGYI